MKLSKIGVVLINLVAMGLVGCGSSSSSPATTAGTTSGTTTTGTTTEGDPNAGVGANPGVVRAPIVAELTTVNLVDLGGHQVFAGPDYRFFEGYSYVNIDFGCDGAGTFELHPAAQFAAFQPVIRGTTSWSVDADGEDMDVVITAVTEGGGGTGEFEADSISINPVSPGTLIVGESTFQSMYVAQIFQYEACS